MVAGASACRQCPRIEWLPWIDDRDVNACWLTGYRELDLVLLSHTAMVVEIGDQLLNDDAQSGQPVLGQSLRLAELTCRTGGLGNRVRPRETHGQPVGI